ncbi:LysM peptidoglycan-binding domain-containing protein [Corallococcus terminator]|uniref:LysM peptidoglycan-binding domain-containing protein n=1 Tax=Corallococcus terminator TaxID=2316733 RepID=A0A3A8JU12_9BACT|nr:LysM peptidoglycan-binding domain-containing protein [Corallococcus terminator]RKG93891.1 LysM peptidoglycan-binding domain-containing protein [Corallococcus terminator]
MTVNGTRSNNSYRVRSGDTLGEIAQRHNTTVDALVRANNLSDPNRILSGTQLTIPGATDGFERAPLRMSPASQSRTSPRNADGFDRGTPAGGRIAPTPRPPSERPAAPAVVAPVPLPLSQRPAAPVVNDSSATPTDFNDTSVIAPATDLPDVRTDTPWISQFDGSKVPDSGNLACFRAATVMAREAGVTVTDFENRIQVATSEGPDGITVNRQAAEQGRDYIDQQLSLGRPVVVGVDHRNNDGQNKDNRDGITDHFVVITGRGTDEQGRVFYTFHDPATRHPSKGADTNPDNRFFVDEQTGNLYRPGSREERYVTDRGFQVSMVRPNA